MISSTQSMQNGSPIRLIGSVSKNINKVIDQDSLHDRLNLILHTFHAEKEQYEDKLAAQKRILQDRINEQSQTILQLQSKVQQLQHQTRQLRFNYHQRGAVVQYLKKKVNIIEKKFDNQKEEMLSVIKYLESRNSQLNEIIYQFKTKQAELNQNIFDLQQKFVNITKEYCNKSMTQKPKLNTKRTSISQNTPTYIPASMQLAKQEIGTSFTRQNISNLFLQDLNNDSFAESSIKEKTIKYENSISRVRSEDEIDFAQLNHLISLEATKQIRNSQIQHVPSKGILINNYGHLTFGDCSQQPRKSNGLTKQKNHYLSRPKLSLPNNGRYPAQLSTRRTNKQIRTYDF